MSQHFSLAFRSVAFLWNIDTGGVSRQVYVFVFVKQNLCVQSYSCQGDPGPQLFLGQSPQSISWTQSKLERQPPRRERAAGVIPQREKQPYRYQPKVNEQQTEILDWICFGKPDI